MKAVVLEAFGDASHFKLKEVETPHPKKAEVRIRIHASGFNPVDYKNREGHYGGQVPLILGADCSGVIDAVGSEVRAFEIGDEVYCMPFGQCSNGSYAEYLCLPAQCVALKPKNLSHAEASVVPLAAMTAYRAMIASRALKAGDSIFIAGAAGGVGTFAVELAKHAKVKEIFSVAGSEESKQHLQEMGLKAHNILLYHGLSCDAMQKRLSEMHGGKLFDASFDFVGGEMKTLCLNVVKQSGHFATIVPEGSSFDAPVWERGVSIPFGKNLSLHCVFVGSEAFSGSAESWDVYGRHLALMTELFEKEALRAPSLKVVGDLSAETVRKAHHLLEGGKVKGKLAMRVSD